MQIHLYASRIVVHLFLFCSLITGAIAQADFTASVTSGCGPLIVNFNALAPGAISYNWDFGNGNFSALASPGVTYISAGLYTVSLTVAYSGGGTETITKPAFIEVFDSPEPDFVANILNICTGESVSFTDLSVPGSGQITSWQWDFGDGTFSNLQSPTHTFQIPGAFGITLITTDANNCTDSKTLNAYILVNPSPNATFTVNNALGCTAPLAVNFFSVNNPPSVTHTWDFGVPGGTANTANPSFTYTNNGTYTVSHIVTDTLGCSDTLVQTNLINVGQTNVVIQASQNSICPGETVTFNCGSGSSALVSWNFGVPGAVGSGCTPSFTYNTPGLYTVSATITLLNGCVLNASTSIFVSTPPVADFTTQDTLLCNPSFDATFVNNSTGAVSYLWAFGDGGSSPAVSPTHTYPTLPVVSPTGQPYYYDVQLIAINSDGCRDTIRKNNQIVTGQTVAEFSALPENGCAPLNVAFQDLSISPSPIIDWQWDYGNGTGVTGVQNPMTLYPDTGSWNVQLIIETLHGCTDTLLIPNYIQAGDTPVADFEIDTLTCASDPVTMTNLSQDADSYFWDFGDGTNSGAFEPIHGFQDTGSLDIMLIAFDRGCPDTMLQQAAIFVLAPLGDYLANPNIICELPTDVTFSNFSLGADHFFWDFGDNSPIDTTESPVHTYTQEGQFSVEMIVTNDSTGCADTVRQAIQIALVEADFAVDTIFGCNPLTVQFSDSSYNAQEWLWDFGDGSGPSQVASPTHIYTDTGRYSVRLWVQNFLQCVDDTLIDPLITVYEPQPNFNVADPTGCAPYSVTYNNLTTSLAPIVSWQWNLGLPGLTSTAFEPTNSYDAGVYTIFLTATDSIGCVNTFSRPNYIQVTEPIPDFSANYPINCPNNQILFTSNATGFGLTYFWNFGDGTFSNAANPVKTYTTPGIYDVSLTVSDILGCDSTLLLPGYVTIAIPEISLIADSTNSDCPPLLVNFTGVSVSPHNFTNWQWDFGDGGTSILTNPSHIYGAPGVFDVDVAASDPSGCAATFSAPNLISVGGPTGSFTFGPQSACPGVPIQFTATGTNVATFQWDIGGGFLPFGQQVTHVYQTPGIYNPVLIIEDTAGCQILITDTSFVEIFAPPVADFSNNNAILCDSGTVTFTDLSQASSSVVAWQWDFGDGFGTSALPNPSYTFTTPGAYDIQLIVTSADGCNDTLIRAGAVSVFASPVALIGASDLTGCAPLNVQFSDLSPGTNSPIATWQWDFTNGTSALQDPLNFFATAGTYPVTLILTDVNGCTDRDSIGIEVFPIPQADFVSDEQTGCAPKLIQFTDLSVNVVDWKWDFGDNSSASFMEDPTHIYTADGTYDVKLQVWDANGCTDSLTRFAYIELDHPEADFRVSDTLICPGQVITFTDLSQGIVPISAWLWDFGNGLGNSVIQNPTYTYPAVPGIFDVSLIVEDANGCRDTMEQAQLIEVLPDRIPARTNVKAVTVLGASRIQIQFDAYANTLGDFGRYVLYREDGPGNWIEIASSTQAGITQIEDGTVQTADESYCYRLIVENFCGTQAPLAEAETHCTMLLTTTPLIDEIAVNWTPYIGWSTVSEYRIYRVQNYALFSAQLIATVPATQTSWIDTDIFCYQGHTYRIEARESGSDLLSWSNISAENPIHLPPVESMHMLVATVAQDSFVQIKWDDLPPGDRQSQLVIEKSSGGGFRELLRQPVSNPVQNYDDFAVEVDVQPYQYRAFVLDSCGDLTLDGRIASSIHLQARREQGLIYLDWTPYETWEDGVDRYVLEAFDEATQQFVEVGFVSGDDSVSFIDRTTNWEQGQYCYHVRAEEAGGNGQVSLSNEACVTIEPLLYYPSAFTPNGDDVNDRFVIPGEFVASFQMEVFNRWGVKIFTTDNMDEGWDGTFNGSPVPEGVYVYTASGIGFLGQFIERSGTITLIR